MANQGNVPHGYHRLLQEFCGPRLIKCHVSALHSALCLLADPQISSDTRELLFTSVSQSSAPQAVKSSLLWEMKMKPGVFSVGLVKEQSPGCVLGTWQCLLGAQQSGRSPLLTN